MVEKNTLRQGRFGDNARGQGVGEGLQSSTNLPDTFTQKDIKRNLKPFKKFGVPQKIKRFRKKTDTQIENIAANAIVKRGLKRGSIKRKKVGPKKINFKRFSKKQVKRARRVMNAENPNRKSLKQTREARQHIRRIRRNRKLASTPLFSRNV